MVENKNTHLDEYLIESWKKTQDNGLMVYKEFPEFNCSTTGRKDVNMFAKFCSLQGKVLDIGCGPSIPSYLKDKNIEVGIGIDPLIEVGGDLGKLNFINAVGEFLPFRHEFFDFVCFATSFDHVLDHVLVLKESVRVLKSKGIVIFWVGEKPVTRPNILNRYYENLSRATRTIERRIVKKYARPRQGTSDLRAEAQAFRIRSMQIPKGAIDQFHLKHVYYNELNDLCELLEFTKIDEKFSHSSVFVKYKKNN